MANSISQRIKQNSAAPKIETAAPQVAPKAVSTKNKNIVDQLVVDHEPVDLASLGTDSHKLAFVCSLGDPSEKDRAEFKRNGTIESRTLPRIIGYRFKVLEDVMVPDFGTTERFNGKRLNNAKDVTNWRQATAGETVDFTRVETLALMSQESFNLEITGGDNPVRLTIAFGRLENLDPRSAEDLPDCALVLKDRSASIKDLPIIEVLDYEPAKEGGAFAVGTRTIKDEFKGTKFEPRALDRTARTLAGTRRTSDGGADKRKSNQRMAAAASVLIQRVAKAQQQG